MTIKLFSRLFLVGTLVLAVSACQTTRKTLNFDTSVELAVDIGKNVNPDNDGRASPVVVRVFLLTDDRQFAREDFLNLYENAESRLGKDLIDTVILKEFAPGERRIENLPLTPEIRYIGLLAEFVQYQNAEALMVLPITDYKKNAYQLTLAGTRITTADQLAARNSSRTRQEASSRRSSSKNKTDDTVTISSEEYERLRAQLRLQEQGQDARGAVDELPR